MNDDDRVLDVAEAILEGRAIPWKAITPPVVGASSPAAEDFQLLADIADAHRAREVFVATRDIKPIERIGSGAFGDVYRAIDTALDREVALKLIRRPGRVSASAEGRLLARVRHPNVVTVYGAAEHDGVYGIWMEFIHGRSLAAIVAERGPLPAVDAVAMVTILCRALAAVHANGLVHGDIKAENVMREDTGRVVLMDFGTSRFVGGSDRIQRAAGTPLYAAPEVLNGETPDARGDLYSMGVLLYFLLTGAFPVDGDTLDEIRAAHDRQARVPVRNHQQAIPPSLARIVDAAVDPDPHARPASAAALESELTRWAAAVQRPKRIAIRAGFAALLVLAAGSAWWWRQAHVAPEIDGSVATSSVAARKIYLEGASLLRSGDPAKAADDFREAVRLDPNFASALVMVTWAQRADGRADTAESAAQVAHALSLSNTLPPIERQFVAGSAAYFGGRIPDAYNALDAVVQDAPDFYWGFWALDRLYARNGRLSEMAPVESRLAALVPGDFDQQCRTAEYFVTVPADLQAAQPFIDRATALAARSTPTLESQRNEVSYVKVFPAFVLWSAGHANEAAGRLDGLMSGSGADDSMYATVGLLDLAMGRLRSADAAFSAMTATSDRRELIALVALARNQTAEARADLLADPTLFDRHLRSPRGLTTHSALVVWAMIQLGMRDEASLSVSQRVLPDVAGALTAWRGDSQGLVQLDNTSRTAPVGKAPALIAIDQLASPLIDAGRLADAEAVLTRMGPVRTTFPLNGASGFIWLRLRAKLLAVERALGHGTRAAEIEREMRQLLGAADPDFSIWQVLTSSRP